MLSSRPIGSACLAALCAAGVFGAAFGRPPTASPAPGPGARSAVTPPGVRGPVAAPSPSPPPGCDKQMAFGEVTLCTSDFTYNAKTGDIQFPHPLRGRTADGSYRADRGFGNLRSEVINLVGHVVLHRD